MAYRNSHLQSLEIELTNNARDNLKKRDYFEQFGIAEGLRRLAEDFPFRPRTFAGAATANRKGVSV